MSDLPNFYSQMSCFSGYKKLYSLSGHCHYSDIKDLVVNKRGVAMKAVIFAGGLGTRLSEETTSRPKPMVEIGSMPILWHIMKIYSAHGINDFIICGGYKQYIIKEFFANYHLHKSNITFDLAGNKMTVHSSKAEDWRVTVVDTGEDTQTGGRLKRVRDFIGDETFCLTYGDGVSDIDISAEIAFHRAHGKLLTMAAVKPIGRFGVVEIDDNGTIQRFAEKAQEDEKWINGGFFVAEPSIIDFVETDQSAFERGPLAALSTLGQIVAFKHDGFWQCMDKLSDKHLLEELWNSGKAPWKVWNDEQQYLAQQARVRDGAHGVQGQLAQPVAEVAAGEAVRVQPGTKH